jgi:hypothetical protein
MNRPAFVAHDFDVYNGYTDQSDKTVNPDTLQDLIRYHQDREAYLEDLRRWKEMQEAAKPTPTFVIGGTNTTYDDLDFDYHVTDPKEFPTFLNREQDYVLFNNLQQEAFQVVSEANRNAAQAHAAAIGQLKLEDLTRRQALIDAQNFTGQPSNEWSHGVEQDIENGSLSYDRWNATILAETMLALEYERAVSKACREREGGELATPGEYRDPELQKGLDETFLRRMEALENIRIQQLDMINEDPQGRVDDYVNRGWDRHLHPELREGLQSHLNRERDPQLDRPVERPAVTPSVTEQEHDEPKPAAPTPIPEKPFPEVPPTHPVASGPETTQVHEPNAQQHGAASDFLRRLQNTTRGLEETKRVLHNRIADQASRLQAEREASEQTHRASFMARLEKAANEQDQDKPDQPARNVPEFNVGSPRQEPDQTQSLEMERPQIQTPNREDPKPYRRPEPVEQPPLKTILPHWIMSQDLQNEYLVRLEEAQQRIKSAMSQKVADALQMLRDRAVRNRNKPAPQESDNIPGRPSHAAVEQEQVQPQRPSNPVPKNAPEVDTPEQKRPKPHGPFTTKRQSPDVTDGQDKPKKPKSPGRPNFTKTPKRDPSKSVGQDIDLN